MDKNALSMYYNKIMNKTKRILNPEELSPLIRMANYRETPPGSSWGWRTIPDFELILIISGNYSYLTHNEPDVKLQSGDVLCIPPGVEHIFRYDGQQEGMMSCIHLEPSKDGTWLNGDYLLRVHPKTVASFSDMSMIQSLFKNCNNLYEGYSKYREKLLCNSGCQIWLILSEKWERGDSETYMTNRTRQMLDYLKTNYLKPVGRQHLSKRFGLSPEHINSIFKHELGISPANFVNRQRVHRGLRYLIEDGLSVKETALKVGFRDEFYFSRVFKKIMDVSPSKVVKSKKVRHKGDR
jgi:AraC-like DNA-binding protein